MGGFVPLILQTPLLPPLVTFVNTALYNAMYKILYLFIMKILEMYLVPGTASSCFVVIALFWLLSAKGKKLL